MPAILIAAFSLMPHVEYNFDIDSAYISRGKVFETRPIQCNDLKLDWALDDFGTIGLWYWNYCSLTDEQQDAHRRFVPEQNYAVTYDYDWKFSDTFSLDTELMVEWQTFHGEKPENSPSSLEWRIKQQLKNPYVTPYYKGRFTDHPVAYNYWQIGLKRKFKPFDKFSLTPNVATDLADRTGVRKRMGRLPAGEGDYRAGFLSIIAELTAEYRLTDNFALHAKLGQFDVVNRKGRGNLHSPQKRDLTYWEVGFSLSF